MKRKIQIILILIFFSIILDKSDCHAKIREGALEGGFSLGPLFADDDVGSENKLLGRLDLGYAITDHIGVELSLANSIDSLDNVPDITLYNINSVFNLSPNYETVPYFTLGCGAANFITDKLDNESMFNISFGVGAKYFLSDDLALKFDIRDYMTTSDVNHNVSLTFGFVYLYDLFGLEAPLVIEEEPEVVPGPEQEVIEEPKEPEPVEDKKVDIEIVPKDEPEFEEPVEEKMEEVPPVEKKEPEPVPEEEPVKKPKKIEEENEWWR